MKKGLEIYPDNEVALPLGIVNVLIDRDTGRLATATTKDPFFEIFIEGTEPGDSDFRQLEQAEHKNGALVDDDFYDLR